MKQLKHIGLKFVGPVIVLTIWQIASLSGLVNALLLPSPITVASAFFSALGDPSLWSDIGVTLSRAGTSLVLGTLVGIPIGLILGYFKRIYAAFEFLIEFFRATPSTALFPLFMLFFGIGTEAKIMLAFWSILFIIILHTMYGVQFGKRTRYKVASVMGFKRFLLFRTFIFPEALPHIVTGLRSGLSTSLIVMVVTEMFIGSDMGIGNRIMDAQLTYRIPEMYAAILVIGTVGYLLNILFRAQEKRIVHWSGKA